MLDPKQDKVNSDEITQSEKKFLEAENIIESSILESESVMKFQEVDQVETPLRSSENTCKEKLIEETEVYPFETTRKKILKTTDSSVKEKETKPFDSEGAKKDKCSKQANKVNYSSLTLEELTGELEKTLTTQRIIDVKSGVDAIKNAFATKFIKLQEQKKAAFLANGGNTIDFKFSSPTKSKYDKLLLDYKKQRDAYYSKLEKQLKENLEKRIQVIEYLKSLIENADSKTMYKSFRDLQKTWKAIGPVPKTKYNDTWRIYHHHVERFYDLLHLSNEFRDLDFKKNLEKKNVLIQKAEALSVEKDINTAFKNY